MARLHSLKYKTHTQTHPTVVCILHVGAQKKPVRSVKHRSHPKPIPTSQEALQQADIYKTTYTLQTRKDKWTVGAQKQRWNILGINISNFFICLFEMHAENRHNSTSRNNITAKSKHGHGLFLLSFQYIFSHHTEQQFWKISYRDCMLHVLVLYVDEMKTLGETVS